MKDYRVRLVTEKKRNSLYEAGDENELIEKLKSLSKKLDESIISIEIEDENGSMRTIYRRI